MYIFLVDRGNRAEKKDEQNKCQKSYNTYNRCRNIFAIETGGKIGHLGLEKSKKWGYTIQNTRFWAFFVINRLLTALWHVQMRV